MERDSITVVREDLNRLRGRLYMTLESFGMTDKQEEACKGVVRKLTYEMQSNLESAIRGHGDGVN